MVSRSTPIVPVILSGGSGTRLWPLSRKAYPKQLHALFSENTLLQETLDRVAHIEPPLVICNRDQRFMVAEQVHQSLGERAAKAHILLEPAAKNTAPAIAAAALYIKQHYHDAIMVVLAADHRIEQTAAFRESLDVAVALAKASRIGIFGIPATRPETGYGYIRGQDLAGASEGLAHEPRPVLAFKEKPDLASAQRYVATGDYFWNSGMFVLSVGTALAELENFQPELLAACKRSVEQGKRDLDFFRLGEEAFQNAPSVAFDHAVMERTDKASVIPLQSDWSDVGSWDAIYDCREKDECANVVEGDCLVEDTERSLIFSRGNRLVSVTGLKDIVVVDTDDALMIADKSRAQQVKTLVSRIEQGNRPECLHYRKQYRPWGWFDDLLDGEGFRVRELMIKPASSLSLQKHTKRAEHWVVISGEAHVLRDDEEIRVRVDESVYVAPNVRHRLANNGDDPLIVIEVSSGRQIHEGDIERF